MKKTYLMLAAVAALFAACSSDSNDAAEKQTAKDQPQEVSFSAYVNRGTTRAGAAGELVTSAGTTNLTEKGFGVFAYYTDNVLYSQTSAPNFMYNEKVTSADGTTWTYSPVKYWPNEFGAIAISDGVDRLTFFAYAPFVNVVPGTGRIDTDKETAPNALTSGIVGLTSNVATGDPYVKYYVDMDPAKSVDLCWGVSASNYLNNIGQPADWAHAKGLPFIDITKPTTTRKIDFDFKHALAWLNVQIDADVDVESHAASSLATGTKIYVRSVTFEGFALKGLLNLNASASEGPLWYELSSTNTKIGSTSVTIFDGRRDGKEGQANSDATNESPSNLNPSIIQDTGSSSAGVTNTAVNLFGSGTPAAPVYVIPTDEPLKVTIVYDVETADEKVAGFLSDGKTHGSSVENKITKEISWTTGGAAAAMEAGKKYTVNLHLGMTSVKFEASVTGWDTGDTADTDLPINKN